MCVLIGHSAGHSNYRPTGNKQAQHVPCGISYNSRLISVTSLAIVKFKLVLVSADSNHAISTLKHY